jgi:mxaD protein
MKTMTATLVALSIFGAGFCSAAAPELHVSKTTTIAAPIATVWDASKNFNGLNGWHPAVATDEIVEGSNNTVGAVRLLTLKGGGTIKEKLLSFDPAAHSFKYAILEGVLPVSGYTSTFVLKSLGADKTSVTWSGSFKRKDLSEPPAAGANDQTALDAISGVYQSGLDNLKKMLESK